MKKPFTTILLMTWAICMLGENSSLPSCRQAAFTENKGQFRDQHGNPNPDVLFMADFGGMLK